MEKKRILFSLSSYGIGGREKQATMIIKNLNAYSRHLLFKRYSGHLFPSVKDSLDSYLNLEKAKLSFGDLLKMKDYIKKTDPHIVIPFCFTSANIILAIKHIFFMKFAILNYTIRDISPFGNRNYLINKIFLNLQKHVIANSHSGLSAYGQSGKKNRHVIPNGYDFSALPPISKTQARKRLDLDEKQFIITMVSRLDKSKDHDTLLNTASLLKNNNDILFLIIGDGDRREYIHREINKLGLDKKVHLYGNRQDIGEILTASDISLLLSYKEGLPNAVLESFACRRPVIATGMGGISEIIDDGINGYIMDQGDHKSIAEKILFLKERPAILDNMGDKALEKARAEFSAELLKSRLDQLINSLLKKQEAL